MLEYIDDDQLVFLVDGVEYISLEEAEAALEESDEDAASMERQRESLLDFELGACWWLR